MASRSAFFIALSMGCADLSSINSLARRFRRRSFRARNADELVRDNLTMPVDRKPDLALGRTLSSSRKAPSSLSAIFRGRSGPDKAQAPFGPGVAGQTTAYLPLWVSAAAVRALISPGISAIIYSCQPMQLTRMLLPRIISRQISTCWGIKLPVGGLLFRLRATCLLVFSKFKHSQIWMQP